MTRKPSPNRKAPPAPPEPDHAPEREKSAVKPADPPLIPDTLPESERIDRQNDLA